MSPTSPGRPPRATHRRSPNQTAAITPAMMHSAYARIGTPARCQTPWLGLGMDRAVRWAVSWTVKGAPSSRRQQLDDVSRHVGRRGALVPDDSCFVAGHAEDVRRVLDLVAAAGQLLAVGDVHLERLAQVDDPVELAGHADEVGVQPVEV